MKVVVTGGSGFVGGALVDCLENQFEDINVVPVSRCDADARFHQVSDYGDTPVGDVLVHFAENPNRQEVNGAGEDYLNASRGLMKCLIEKGYEYVIYVSSSVVYRDQGCTPYVETSEVEIVDNYTKIKLENEARVISSGGAVVRLTNVVGSGMAKNTVLSDILDQVPGEGDLTVRNGRPVRDFISVVDVAYAISLLITKKVTGVFNIGSGVGFSVRDLAQLTLEVVGEPRRVVVSLNSSEHSSFNVVDISKITRAVGWAPRVDINNIINLLFSEKADQY